MKIQTKTTLLFTVLTGAFFIILDITVYYFLNKAAHNDFNKRLELRAKISSKFRFEKDHVSTESFREIQREYLEKLADEKAYVFQVDSATHQFSPAPPPEIDQRFLNEIVQADSGTVFRQKKFRHYAGLLYHDETGDFIVIKSATNAYGIELLDKLRDIMIITFICAVILIFIVGHYFAKRSFRPFRTITDKANQINENNLHLRLEETAGTDEVAELTQTFNKMIDRIEVAFESQNNFISNASHELRTPLTAIVAESDYILSKERSEAAYRQSIEHIQQQASRLQHLTKGLLDLAQTGFDGKKITWEKIRLDQLLFDVKESMDDILPENHIVVSISNFPEDENDISISGSYNTLKIAVTNIVLNACKYSNNQQVDLQLSFNKKYVIITVMDKGIGIPADDLKHIYDPFFRASNTGKYDGYGIGMPLSFNIIRLHKGKIEVVSTEGKGTVVEIMLPLGK
ncbi:sensor histidine kinase [Ferruginibacter sp.]